MKGDDVVADVAGRACAVDVVNDSDWNWRAGYCGVDAAKTEKGTEPALSGAFFLVQKLMPVYPRNFSYNLIIL